MRKTLLSALAIFAIGSLSAQYEIRLDGTGSDIAGTTIDVDVTPGTLKEVKLWVLNTGSNQDVYITRVREDMHSGWLQVEELCWPPLCYLGWANQGDTYATPNSGGINGNTGTQPTITTTQSSDGLVSMTSGAIPVKAELKPKITPSASATGSALFTYYLTAVNGTYLDSISVRYNTGISSVKENQKLDLSLFPNPASNNLTVAFDGANTADLKMVDVLGNVVLKKSITGKESIDVSNFRNGIYFVAVSSEGIKPVVRKIIVRH